MSTKSGWAPLILPEPRDTMDTDPPEFINELPTAILNERASKGDHGAMGPKTGRMKGKDIFPE